MDEAWGPSNIFGAASKAGEHQEKKGTSITSVFRGQLMWIVRFELFSRCPPLRRAVVTLYRGYIDY